MLVEPLLFDPGRSTYWWVWVISEEWGNRPALVGIPSPKSQHSLLVWLLLTATLLSVLLRGALFWARQPEPLNHFVLKTDSRPGLQTRGGDVSQTKEAMFSRTTEGFLSLVYIGTKDWMLSLCALTPMVLGYKKASGSVSPENFRGVCFKPHLLATFLSLLKAVFFEIEEAWHQRPSVSYKYIFSLKCLSRTSESGAVSSCSHAHLLDAKWL